MPAYEMVVTQTWTLSCACLPNFGYMYMYYASS
jgi:hypothetical protein